MPSRSHNRKPFACCTVPFTGITVASVPESALSVSEAAVSVDAAPVLRTAACGSSGGICLTFTVSASLLLPPPAWLTMGRITPRTTKTSRRIAAIHRLSASSSAAVLTAAVFCASSHAKLFCPFFTSPFIYSYLSLIFNVCLIIPHLTLKYNGNSRKNLLICYCSLRSQ